MQKRIWISIPEETLRLFDSHREGGRSEAIRNLMEAKIKASGGSPPPDQRKVLVIAAAEHCCTVSSLYPMLQYRNTCSVSEVAAHLKSQGHLIPDNWIGRTLSNYRWEAFNPRNQSGEQVKRYRLKVTIPVALSV